MNTFKQYLTGLSALLLMGSAMAGEKIPAIPEIPPAVAANHAELAMQRAALLQERASLKARIAMNQIECASVKQNSAEDAKCTQDTSAISTDVDRHVQATQRFINSLNDPMVVDARNVPSGLPKSVEDAIPKTPAGDRVRKGFQAIVEHDWKVALAWFKDALNHEPGSPGLQRLVDLAQYTLQKRSEPAVKPIDAATTATMEKIDKILESGMSEELNRSLNDYYKNNPPKLLKQGKGFQSDTEWLNEKEPAWKNFFRLFTPRFRINEDGTIKGIGTLGIRG